MPSIMYKLPFAPKIALGLFAAAAPGLSLLLQFGELRLHEANSMLRALVVLGLGYLCLKLLYLSVVFDHGIWIVDCFIKLF